MDAPTGLRERKKRRTREAIVRAALGLFEQHGYDGATLPDIARVADISTRTIFSYFPSKQDILFFEFPALGDALAHALAARRPGEDAFATVRDFILAEPHGEDAALYERRERLIANDDVLRGSLRARMARLEEIVAAAIAEDLGAPEVDLRARVAAASLIAGLEALPSDAGHDPRAAVDSVVAFVRAGLTAFPD